MRIWLINHYAVPPQYYPLARQNYFAKYLIEMGHDVTIFAASTVHNSDINLIEDNVLYKEDKVDGIPYVYVKCKDYVGNGLKRIFNMLEFAIKFPKICAKYPKPDAIVATSVTPMACAQGIRLARKYKCKGIAEIADLWPESIVAYGIAGKNNPAVVLLRILEKWIYKKSDAIIFTMEGAYDYIKEQNWEHIIPKSKVFHINNGVDIEAYDYNKEHYLLNDADLSDANCFKVAYAGSIRKANNVDFILDIAKETKEYDIKYLIWGDGTEKERLMKRVHDENLYNVVFKGKVDKKYVPYIGSNADCNIFVLHENPLYRFGLSLNKSFEYLAAGKPILMVGDAEYSMVEQYNCGIHPHNLDAREVAKELINLSRSDENEYLKLCDNSRKAAKEYDFKVLTEKLLNVINNA